MQHLEGKEWATTLADDIGAAIDYTLRNVKAEHVDSTKVSVAMQWAVEFALLGQVTVPTDQVSQRVLLSQWSAGVAAEHSDAPYVDPGSADDESLPTRSAQARARTTARR